jgi:ABC-type hemin transport system substrate-binding protein
VYRARDVRGHWLTLRRRPERIVSLVPSLSELVCALGASRRLVGVTRYCTHPPAVMNALRRVGGTKNPSCAAIIELQPDLVLANMEENRAEDVEALSTAGVPVYVTFPQTVRTTATMIGHIGRLIGAVRSSTVLATHIAFERRRQPTGRRARVFCPIWRNPWMTFNRQTYAHDVLRLAGAYNVCAARTERYPHVTLEEVAALKPDLILLPSEPYRFSARHFRYLDPLQDTPAHRNRRIYLVDGQALSWYGPRTPRALQYFRRLLPQGS